MADGLWHHVWGSRQKRPLMVVERTGNRRWTLNLQHDGSFTSQFSLDVNVTNVTDSPIRIVATRLIRPNPKQDLINAVAMIDADDRHPNDPYDVVPPHVPARVNLFFLVHRKLAPQGETLRITVGLTDQFGYEYRVKNISIRSPQARDIT